MALAGDPGKLDPQSSASTQLFTVNQFAYDTLVSVDGESGEIQSQLATDWEVDGTTVTFTLGDGITCADGSAFTATTSPTTSPTWRPEEQEPLPRHLPPGGRDREGRRRRRHRDVTLAAALAVRRSTVSPACRWSATSGMEDRTSLAGHRRHRPVRAHRGRPGRPLHLPDPRRLHVGSERRDDGGGRHARHRRHEGRPERGHHGQPAALRRDQRGHDPGPGRQAPRRRPTCSPPRPRPWSASSGTTTTPVTRPSDAAVRMALTQALDLGELASVATAGEGTPATTLAALQPVACPGDTVSGGAAGPGRRTRPRPPCPARSSPSSTPAPPAAPSPRPPSSPSQQWEAAGAEVTAEGRRRDRLQGAIFGTGDWDIAWVPLNVNSPDQLCRSSPAPAWPTAAPTSRASTTRTTPTASPTASAMTGTEGCDTLAGGRGGAVRRGATSCPFANNLVTTFGKGAEFEYPGTFMPTSIRMLAE